MLFGRFCLNDKRKIRLLCGKSLSHGPKCSIGGNENRLSVKQANVSCETLACFTYYNHRTLFVVLCGSRILGYGDLTNLLAVFVIDDQISLVVNYLVIHGYDYSDLHN